MCIPDLFHPHHFSQTPPTLWRLASPPLPLWPELPLSFLNQVPPLLWPLSHLVSRSRKIQTSSRLPNLSVSNSDCWLCSLGLGSWGLWVRGNAFRILFRNSDYSQTNTLRYSPIILVKWIGRHLVQKEGEWVMVGYATGMKFKATSQRGASSWGCKVRMVAREILNYKTTWTYEVLICLLNILMVSCVRNKSY